MGFALSILFVIYGGAYYIIRYMIESGKNEALKAEYERECQEKYERDRPRREREENEARFKDAMEDYLSSLT